MLLYHYGSRLYKLTGGGCGVRVATVVPDLYKLTGGGCWVRVATVVPDFYKLTGGGCWGPRYHLYKLIGGGCGVCVATLVPPLAYPKGFPMKFCNTIFFNSFYMCYCSISTIMC